MARAPKCRFCKREHYGVCNPGLRGESKVGAGNGDTPRLGPAARTVAMPSAPSLAQIQAEKEATFTALVTESPAIKRHRGRPKKEDALTPAQRTQRWRAKRALHSQPS